MMTLWVLRRNLLTACACNGMDGTGLSMGELSIDLFLLIKRRLTDFWYRDANVNHTYLDYLRLV